MLLSPCTAEAVPTKLCQLTLCNSHTQSALNIATLGKAVWNIAVTTLGNHTRNEQAQSGLKSSVFWCHCVTIQTVSSYPMEGVGTCQQSRPLPPEVKTMSSSKTHCSDLSRRKVSRNPCDYICTQIAFQVPLLSLSLGRCCSHSYRTPIPTT